MLSTSAVILQMMA
ncbi:unnamed protein product [Allacma fusca]|uniref:Uncharacterized protein n=1 Tax=Allacma fusca TaxID=39272 RepID=A0A8J2L2Z3_9HEXA|nr:unnamed protein product [Allacma fusca]